MLSVAVCDDSAVFLKEIMPLLEQAAARAGAMIDASSFDNGQELLSRLEAGQRYDVVLLDIDMPNIDGKQLAARLRILDSECFLVFITSYKAEVYNTIPFRISAFISKDSADDGIIRELARVIGERLAYKPLLECFEAEKDGASMLLRLSVNDIFYCCCVSRRLYLHTGTEQFHLTGCSFAEIEQRLLAHGFFETCRGYAVNTAKVKSVTRTTVTLDNGSQLPLSRGRYKPLFERIAVMLEKEVTS